MRALTALQMAFCILVLFITGLFLSTFDRISAQPTGFTAEGLLVLETGSHEPVPYSVWEQTGEHLRRVAGVESAGLSGWPLMEGSAWTSGVFQNGQPRHDGPEPYFLAVSPHWLDTMKIQMIDGRDFRAEDFRPNAAIVNESFARQYFNGENPVGRTFETLHGSQLISNRIVGYVRDTRYRDMREPIRPVVFVPYQSRNQEGKIETSNWGTFIVRTSPNDPSGAALASILRREVPKARPELRVTNITTQSEIVRAHLIRERLLALLSGFFAIVALILAGVGLFGVIHYAMLQRRREIGIRMALGARSSDVARRVTAESFVMLSLGAIAGLAAGVATAKYIEPLLFGVRSSDPAMIVIPASILIATAIAAALPPVLQAVRIDPSQSLRIE
jgi:predicted permease